MKNDDEDEEESFKKDGGEALPNACRLASIRHSFSVVDSADDLPGTQVIAKCLF